jgi:hypothetical protein
MFTSHEIGFVIPLMVILLAILYILPDTLVSFKDLFETLKKLFRKGGTAAHKLAQKTQYQILILFFQKQLYLFFLFGKQKAWT